MRLIAAMLVLGVTASACARVATRESWELADLTAEPVERTQLDSVAGLDVERVRFRSEATGDLRFFIALIPQNHPVIADVLILSHGWGDRPESLLQRLDVARAYADLLARGEVRPAVLVLPDVRFDAKYRRNSEEYPFPQYLGLIGEEVHRIVSDLYPIRPDDGHWHAGGFSFGGFLSLDLGRRYSARFGSVGVISAFGDPEWSYWPTEPPPPGRVDDQGRGKHTLVDPGPVPRLLLACGTGDRFYPRMLGLHEHLSSLDVDHVWMTGPGGHDFGYWNDVLEPMLLFHLGTEPLVVGFRVTGDGGRIHGRSRLSVQD